MVIEDATFEVIFKDGNVFYAYECKTEKQAIRQALENSLIDHEYIEEDVESVRINYERTIKLGF